LHEPDVLKITEVLFVTGMGHFLLSHFGFPLFGMITQNYGERFNHRKLNITVYGSNASLEI